MFCNHEWKVLLSTVTESKFEVAMRTMPIGSKFTIPHQMACADRAHIEILTCANCGKLKRFVENI